MQSASDCFYCEIISAWSHGPGIWLLIKNLTKASQSSEHRNHNPGVGGSSPSLATTDEFAPYSSEDWAIERYLGRGVDGLVIPRLETAAQAARVVAAVRYCCPENSDKKLIVIQIETLSTLQKPDEFLRVDGIDTYFLGPVELAKSLGFAGDYRRSEVQDAIDDATTTIRSAGKAAGILVDRGNAQSYANRGVQFLYTHANDFLRHGSDEFARLIMPSAR